MTESQPKLRKRGSSEKLIVILHAYCNTPEMMEAVVDAIGSATDFDNTDLIVPRLPFSAASLARPINVTVYLLKTIDELWEQCYREIGRGYQEIIFVGHSMGALFSRKVYACACGETALAPFEPDLKDAVHAAGLVDLSQQRPWADKVTRIILLAAMNRGWSISHHLSVINGIGWTIGTQYGNLLTSLGCPPIILSVRRGASFLIQMRIQWLAMRRYAPERGVGKAVTIQLLGSIDDIVSPDDNVDLVSGRDFYYMDVPASGHSSIIQMGEPGKSHTEEEEQRRQIFLHALRADEAELQHDSLPPADFSLPEQKNIKNVIFVIHGIRDVGFWTQKIARRVMKAAGDQRWEWASETSTYGYFPMLSFLWPRRRQEKVEWLMDQYAEALALYPNATGFHYVGHSHGTYLLAKALREYPSCQFKRVVFAGSVVPCNYDWSGLIKAKRVEAVLNYVATADWVVAFFPKALQIVHIQDLGSAGFDGFKAGDVQQINYVVGDHGAALKEQVWESIANFVVGKPYEVPAASKSNKQSVWVKYPSIVAPLIWLVIVALLAYVFILIVCWQTTETVRILSLGFYLWLIWQVLTKL